MEKELASSIVNELVEEGINSKGYGKIPKAAMLDLDLSLEAKSIYAYFCSYSGRGTSIFPGYDKIMYDLQMSKDAYYKHYNNLLSEGYITVKKETGKKGFQRNLYIIESLPAKYLASQFDDNSKVSKIRLRGLKASGFGIIPKLLMQDRRISVKAKGLYAYYCSFAGSGDYCCPEKSVIMAQLGVSHNSLVKYNKELTTYNYISVKQRFVDGRLSVNDYIINDNPNIEQQTKNQEVLDKTQRTKKQEILKNLQQPKIQETKFQETLKQETKNQEANNNSINKNKFTRNKSNQSFDGATEKEKISLIGNRREVTLIVQRIADYEELSQKKFHSSKKEYEAYMLCIEALIDLLVVGKNTKIQGEEVSPSDVEEKLNAVIKETGWEDISNFILINVCSKFIDAANDKEIKNPLGYMKSCIWDALKTRNYENYV